MAFLAPLRRYWRDWRYGKRVDDEIAAELDFHLQMRATENMGSGMTPADAEADARARFGSVGSIHERCRDVRGLGAVDMFFQDLRFGLRLLRRSPGFTIASVVTLALGIGTSAAVFTVTYAVLLRPLPFPDAHELVTVWQSSPVKSRAQVAAANWRDWAAQSRTVAPLAAYAGWNFTFTGRDEAHRAKGTIVTGSFFEVLGVPAALGRTLQPQDDTPAGDAIVISDGLWRRRFAGDRSIVGRSVQINGHAAHIVGVMPAGFAFPGAGSEVWSAIGMDAETAGNRAGEWLRTIGRLRDGAELVAARAEFARIAGQLAESYPETNHDESATVVPLHHVVVEGARPTLLVLSCAVSCLLLIACVNLGGLLLARSGARRREVAVRVSLGATRGRVLRQLITESLLIAACGATVGLVLGMVLVQALVALSPEDVPRLAEVRFGAASMAFILAASTAAVLVFGAWPATRIVRADLRRDLAGSGQGQADSRFQVAQQTGVVAAQVAFAFVLLVAAALLLQSFRRLSQVDPGFDASGVMTLRLSLPRAAYPDNDRQAAFFEAVTARIRALPGVDGADAVNDLPVTGNSVGFPLEVRDGFIDRGVNESPVAGTRFITPGYFATMRMRMRRGRPFTARDDRGAVPVVIVNATLARRYWDGEAMGRQLRVGGGQWRTVVGIVPDVKHLGLDRDEGPVVYLPLAQKPFPFLNWMTIVARGANPAALAAPMRAAVGSVDSTQAAYDVMTLEQRLRASIAMPRLSMSVMMVLALAAIALTIVGLYGTIAFLVTQRTREIGLRIALGATRGGIVRLVLGRAALMIVAGLSLGAGAAAAAGRLLTSLLFGVTPWDLSTFGASLLLFSAVGLLASYVPARRASRIDPTLTMKTG